MKNLLKRACLFVASFARAAWDTLIVGKSAGRQMEPNQSINTLVDYGDRERRDKAGRFKAKQ